MTIDDPSGEREEDAAKELLLADLSHLQESFWKNEETGEKRVTFFITLVTVVITALVAISGEKGVTDNLLKELLLYFAFSSLFVVGIVTLFRLIKRNEVTDGYKKDMLNIRERFQRILFHTRRRRRCQIRKGERTPFLVRVGFEDS